MECHSTSASLCLMKELMQWNTFKELLKVGCAEYNSVLSGRFQIVKLRVIYSLAVSLSTPSPGNNKAGQPEPKAIHNYAKSTTVFQSFPFTPP